MTYDMCVLTGDYRGATFGPFDAALAGLALARTHLRGPIYGVLGNHDSILMVPELEDMGVRVLLNECEIISRGDEAIYLAGIDDAHYYRVDNIEKAASEIPRDGFSILLSHTPEVYRQAAHAGFDVFLSGHTHGGQICLPRFYSDHAWFGSAETYGLGVMAIWRYDWLHLGWSGMRGRSGPL
jgi:predicted MPP superfamily phosphohydrolase